MERTINSNNGQPLYMMTAEELSEHTRQIVRETIEILMPKQDAPVVSIEQSTSDLLTSKEVVLKLRISQTMLWKLEKQGKLTPTRIGRRVLYRRADVESLINKK